VWRTEVRTKAHEKPIRTAKVFKRVNAKVLFNQVFEKWGFSVMHSGGRKDIVDDDGKRGTVSTWKVEQRKKKKGTELDKAVPLNGIKVWGMIGRY
jgi:hypothetical protein